MVQRDESESVGEQLQDVFVPYQGRKRELIPLLQEVQERFGYISCEAMIEVAQFLNIPESTVYGVVTFYAQFYLEPRGRHIIKVCEGTACYIMGGKDIMEHLEKKLGINEDETTEDGRFTIERVACLGCCGMAPVIMIDNDFYGRCTVQQTNEALKKYN